MKVSGCIFFILLCFTNPAPIQAETYVDQAGRQVTLASSPQRIISLMPSVTEIFFDLGAGERLKGVTMYSNEPPAAAQLPKVGSYVHLDLEKIISLEPDLCLAVRDGNPIHIINKITALGIPVFTVDPRNLEEIMESIEMLGRVLEAEDKAKKITLAMKKRIAAAEKNVPEGRRPAVFFQIDAAPIISAGSNTFIDQLISRAGGVNLAAGPTPYPRYSWEDILLMQPEIVLIASMAGGHSPEDLKAGWMKWTRIPAVKNKKLYVVDAGLFDRPTARLIDGLEILVEIFADSRMSEPADKRDFETARQRAPHP